MPHIDTRDRVPYLVALGDLSTALQYKPLGHLTYVLYVIARRYMFSSTSGTMPPYDYRSSCCAGLTDAERELRRLHVDPYEDEKINTNGEAV